MRKWIARLKEPESSILERIETETLLYIAHGARKANSNFQFKSDNKMCHSQTSL